MWQIEFYKKENGEEPASDFIKTLNPKFIAKILREIDILRQYGNECREPVSKPLGGGLFELRIKLATDISRILYFFCDGRKIVLINGFIKKTQRTPKNELEKARKYKSDYERRAKI
jgi:phage-related protein